MAQKVLILGDSGTGKSASMRNFSEGEVFVINSAGKPLPFRSHFESITPSFNTLTSDIMKALKSTNKKVIVIDDVQYILSFPMMRRIKESGWEKWNDIQGDFFNIIQACDDLPKDVIVYFLSHLQRTDDGHEKIKTVGKMLDEKITIEGLFTVVLKTIVADGKYYFQTQNSGMDTVKSPIGMFDTYAIDNDLKYVDAKIRNYYEIGEHEDDETIKKMDQEAKAEDIVKPDSSGRRSRRKKDTESTQASDTGRNGNAADVVNGSDGDEKPQEVSKVDEQPKRRRRKISDEKEEVKQEEPEQAQAEDEKEEAAAEKPKRRSKRSIDSNIEQNATENKASDNEGSDSEHVTTVEKPKRRRRKQRTEVTAEDLNFEPISDDDIPF